MYTEDHIFLVLPIKLPINKYSEPTKAYKIATGMKHSILNLRVLFCPCVVRKATAHIGTKALNMNYQAQKSFCVIFIGIQQHQKGYLVYVPHRQKIISLYNVVFGDILSSDLAHTSQSCAECYDYETGCVIHSVFYIFKVKNWQYNHFRTV